MTKASEAELATLLFDEQASDPAAPGSGFWRVYFKSDGIYIIDDAGTVVGPLSTGGGGGAGGALRAYLSANQAIADNTVTTVVFDTIQREDDADGDLSLNTTTGVVTVNNAGWYSVAATVWYPNNSSGRREVFIQDLSGSIRIADALDDAAGSTATDTRMNCACAYYFAATSTFDVKTYQNSGGSLNLQGDGTLRITSLSVVKLRS